MEYLKFYGLAEEPFRNDPDVRFFFESRSQREARMRLLRGLAQRRSLLALVAGPGHGKSTLARHLLEQLEADRFCPRLLLAGVPDAGPGWLLARIAGAFGAVADRPDSSGVVAALYGQLVEFARAGRHPVLLVDEAQSLRDPRALAELRTLLGLEHAGERLLSVVLVGLEELGEALAAEPALAQRVEIRARLGPLGEAETAAYVETRLRRAGAHANPFTPDALGAIHRWTGGVPRLVNTLADNALFEGFLARAPRVDADVVAAAAAELGWSAPEELPAAPAPAGKRDGRAPDATLVSAGSPAAPAALEAGPGSRTDPFVLGGPSRGSSGRLLAERGSVEVGPGAFGSGRDPSADGDTGPQPARPEPLAAAPGLRAAAPEGADRGATLRVELDLAAEAELPPEPEPPAPSPPPPSAGRSSPDRAEEEEPELLAFLEDAFDAEASARFEDAPPTGEGVRAEGVMPPGAPRAAAERGGEAAGPGLAVSSATAGPGRADEEEDLEALFSRIQLEETHRS